MITDFWTNPVVVAPNNFVYKSLSNWSCNPAVGCEHACRFCYVPSASTIKLGAALKKYGVDDPDKEWGEYVFVRPFDEKKFRASVQRAELTKKETLKPDGNRAIMFSTTTDSYQVIRNKDRTFQAKLQAEFFSSVRQCLRIILEESTLNVRILTRSPLAKVDFELMKQFGNRLLFGMSLPTLRNDLARIYEPKAPAPSQRLATLKAAKEAGLNVYVACAPVYPDCDKDDMAATLQEIKQLDPVSVFMEPINIRSENVARINTHAESLGVKVKTEVFSNTTFWSDYAFEQLMEFERLSKKIGISDDVLHLWPDRSLEKWAGRVSNGGDTWLRRHWNKISAWPN